MFRLLNIISINSQVVYKFNTGDYKMKSRRIFEKIRTNISKGAIICSLCEKINKFTGEQSEEAPKEKTATAHGRCSFCPQKADRKTKFEPHIRCFAVRTLRQCTCTA